MGYGPVLLFGSQDFTPSAQRIHDSIWRTLPRPVRAAVLETPAGFEPNSAAVAGKMADFFKVHLQNYRPTIDIVAARKKGTAFSPDDPAICAPLLSTDYVYLGAGSPTYTVRQLSDSLAWAYLRARHALGGAIAFESAATVAISRYAMPIYEIYKVGEELHWKDGLDFFGAFNLPIVIVPHWNNNDGGEALDTNRCYIGKDRFAALIDLLPGPVTLLGIEDKTAVAIDFEAGSCQVMGVGGVVIDRQGDVQRVEAGATFPLTALGDLRMPDDPGVGAEVWEAALAAREAPPPAEPDAAVLALFADRNAARAARDWARSDSLRAAIADRGWRIEDTPDGPRLRLLGD